MGPQMKENKESSESVTDEAGNTMVANFDLESAGQVVVSIPHEQRTDDPCQQDDLKPEEPAPEDQPAASSGLRVRPVADLEMGWQRDPSVQQDAPQMPPAEAALDIEDANLLDNAFINPWMIEENDFNFDAVLHAIVDPEQLMQHEWMAHFFMALTVIVALTAFIFKDYILVL